MKKIYAFLLILSFAFLAFTPFVMESFEAKADGTQQENIIKIDSFDKLSNVAENVNIGSDDYFGKTLKLTSDITITGAWNPIGSQNHVFKGNFDGNGFSIDVSNAVINGGSYQGIFGYVSGGEFKNVQIIGNVMSANGQLLPSSSNDEVYSGLFIGMGESVSITNCELILPDNYIENDILISKKTTVGALAGKLVNSTISNVVSYLNLSFTYELANAYTIKIGGLVGVGSNVVAEKVVVFGDSILKVENQQPQKSSTLYLGGLFGEIEGGKIKDSVQGGNVKIENKNDVDKFKVATVVGNILVNPQSGDISSVAYYASSQEEKAFGVFENDDEITYKPKNTATNDYVMRVLKDTMLSRSFYTSLTTSFVLDGTTYTFGWNEDLADWDFANTWVLVSSADSTTQLRLQAFQYFKINLSSVLDSRLTSVEGFSEAQVQYGESTELKVTFKGSENDVLVDNSKYYDVTDISLNGESLGLENFIEESEGVFVSKDGNYKLVKSIENGKTVYSLTVVASNATEGNYSFVLTAIKYPAYFVAGQVKEDGTVDVGANGGIRYKGTTATSDFLNKELYKGGTNVEIEALGDKTYVFTSWSLYYLDSNGTVLYNGQKWKEAEDVSFESTSNPLKVVFGGDDKTETAFNQTFLLIANFVNDPCSLTFSFDPSLITKVDVNGQEFSTSGQSALLDKNESVVLKIYVSKNVKLNVDSLSSSIKNMFASNTSRLDYDTYTDPLNDELIVHEFTFSTSSFNYASSSNFTFSLRAEEGEGEEGNDPTVWIVVGVVGGVVLLATAGLVTWLVLRKRNAGGGKDDYKKYYY